MKKLLPLLLACVFTLPAALVAANFEGKVTMKLTGPRDTPPEMIYSIKAAKTRIDLTASGKGGERVAMLIDSTQPEMTILMLDQKMFMTQTIPKAAAGAGASDSATVIEKTTVTEKILGYDCVKYLAKSKDSTAEIWATDQLGSFPGLGGGNPMGGGRGAKAGQPWESALTGLNAFPLRVVTSDGGKNAFRMEATAVEKKSLPDSTFVAPDGFQDLSAMLRGMGLPPGMKIPGTD